MKNNQELPSLWVQDGLDIVELLKALNNFNNSPATDLDLINLQHEDTLQGFIEQFDCSMVDILNTDDSVINQVGDLLSTWLENNMHDGTRLRYGFNKLANS